MNRLLGITLIVAAPASARPASTDLLMSFDGTGNLG
jgi:hypothetical protein